MAAITPRGDTFRVTVRIPGGTRKTATFDTQVEAQAWADKMERKKEIGQLTPTRAAGVTVGQLFEAYLDAVALKTDSAKWNKIRIDNWCLDPLAERRLADIVTHDINEWMARRGEEVSDATVNREMNLMSGAFTYAVKDRRWIDVNPCHGARRPPKGKPRKRPLLTDKEVEAINIATGYKFDPQLRTLTSRVGACFLLSLETGMRSGELLRLRPIDFFPEDDYVHVSALEKGGRKGAKSGRATVDASRNVPLSGSARRLIEQLLATMPADQPYIVGIDDSQRDALWRKAVKQAGIVDLHFHDTKHEACTRLCRFLDVIELSKAVGTKDIRLLRDTYYNYDASEAAKRLPDSVAMSGRGPKKR